MAASTNPVFTDTPRIGAVAIATANANRDGTGTIGTVLTAGSDGTLLSSLTVKATVTTTAGTVRIYFYDGATYYLFYEIAVPAITVSATQTSFYYNMPLYKTVLPTGWSVRASTEKAENFNVIVIGEDF